MAVNDQLSRSGVLLGTSALVFMLELHVRTNSFIREIAARLTMLRETTTLPVCVSLVVSCCLMAVRAMSELDEWMMLSYDDV